MGVPTKAERDFLQGDPGMSEARNEGAGSASRPLLQVGVDAADFHDLRQKLEQALRPRFQVTISRVYELSEPSVVRVILELGVPFLQWIDVVGTNVFSDYLWDGLKPVFMSERAEMPRYEFWARRSDGSEVRLYLSTRDSSVMKEALDNWPLRELANPMVDSFGYDEGKASWIPHRKPTDG
jgi:hypothetical protein